MATLKTINVQQTFNTGNYTSIRFGGDFELVEGEDLTTATEQAKAAIAQMYAQWQQQVQAQVQGSAPKAQEPSATGKPLVNYGDKVYKGIIKRIQDTTKEKVTMETIEAHYQLSDTARNSIDLAIKLT